MPIYDFRCLDCDASSSALVWASDDEGSLRCPQCGGGALRKVPSRFALHRTERQRIAEVDRRAVDKNSFYADRRNVGIVAKRRAADLGVDLGPDFDEAVERARTAKHIEDL